MTNRSSIPLLLAALCAAAGCRTRPPDAPGLDRAVAGARTAILDRHPDVPPENLRLSRIHGGDASPDGTRAYLVIFEDLATLQISTNADGSVTRAMRQLQARGSSDGTGGDPSESRHSSTRKARR